jgi:hypothetical protein
MSVRPTGTSRSTASVPRASQRPSAIEELLQGYSAPQDPLGEEELFKQLKKKLLERALGAELSEHLGYEKGDPAGQVSAWWRLLHNTAKSSLDSSAASRNGQMEPPPALACNRKFGSRGRYLRHESPILAHCALLPAGVTDEIRRVDDTGMNCVDPDAIARRRNRTAA